MISIDELVKDLDAMVDDSIPWDLPVQIREALEPLYARITELEEYAEEQRLLGIENLKHAD